MQVTFIFGIPFARKFAHIFLNFVFRFFFPFYPCNIFWQKLNPHNKWKCVRCWKWKKSCAIGPYENIHKVYVLCYSAVYFLPILLFDVTVLFKAYRKNLQQHKQAEPLFHMKKKIWFENFLLRHLTLLKNIKGINKLFFEVLDIYVYK